MEPPYLPEGRDEALDSRGAPRPAYAGVLADLAGTDLETLASAVREDLVEHDVNFRSESGLHPFLLDPVPRVLEAAEWNGLVFGMLQRARALNAFIADVYGEMRIVKEGVVPERVVRTADHYEPDLIGVPAPGGHAPVIGFDLVRGADGRFVVLEENLRTPSGLAYASAARETLDEVAPYRPPKRRREVAPTYDALQQAIRAADPTGGGDPSAALLTEGKSNAAWYEHERIANTLGIPIVTADDLRVRGGRLYRTDGGSTEEIQVLYRRTDEDRFTDEDGRPTWTAELLLEPLRGGRLALVNAPGAGVGDDKLTHAYVGRMIRFYLGHEPLLQDVRTYDLGERESRAEVLARLPEMVVKPRSSYGGEGVVICGQAADEDLGKLAGAIEEDPERYIAQEIVELSTHPTIIDGELVPRRVDLRAFSVRHEVVPAAVTRVALEEGSMIVNSSRDGGAKDTWVLE